MKFLFAISKLLVVAFVIASVSGCASMLAHTVSPKSYKATEAKFTSKDLDEQLHQKYVKQELDALDNSSSSGRVTAEILLDEKLMAAPKVIFSNEGAGKLLVTVQDSRGHKHDRTVWKFDIDSGATVVFPDDYPEAAVFRRGNSYFASGKRRGRAMETTFVVSVRTKGWENRRNVSYNGGVVFNRGY